LSLVKSFQRHQIRGPRSENRVQRNLQATLNVKHPTPNADRRTKEDRDQRSEVRENLARYVFRASSIRSTLSLPEPTKVKRMVI
jgi:hypothetical protein